VTADTEVETKVDTEGTDEGTGLARNAKDNKLALFVELEELAGVDRADTAYTQHPTPNTQHPTTNTQQCISSTNMQHPIRNTQHSTPQDATPKH
jgi:hypothetical protein